ncbi:MAG TPA: hypothetical protein VK013_05365 [Myxococcaceae bacterium]|nr:hypothetical protein [Myxococcaceae bacterium]
MRRILVSLLVALPLVGCVEIIPRPPPSDRFYYPMGLVHVDVPGAEEGMLYVASANGDRCYDNGAIRAVDLDALPGGLPPLGAPVAPTGPVQLESLGADAPELQVQIGTFAGEMAVWARPEGGHRLVVPSRVEGGLLNVVDAAGASLTCVPASDAEGGRDCTPTALALETALEDQGEKDVQRSLGPYGVSIADDGEMFVTHSGYYVVSAGAQRLAATHVVRMNAADPTVTKENYREVLSGGTQSVAIGSRYAFVSARNVSPPNVVIGIPRDPADNRVLYFPLQNQLNVQSARGIALSADQRRLYVIARAVDELFGGNPDQLLVLNVEGADTNAPSLSIIRQVPLPALPSSLRLIERAGSTPLALMTMQGSESLAIYDDAVGQLVTEVLGIGLQPSQFTVDLREADDGSGGVVAQARIFISNFGDGRVAVVDLPDLRRPEDARLVAHIGQRQDVVESQQSKTCRMVE